MTYNIKISTLVAKDTVKTTTVENPSDQQIIAGLRDCFEARWRKQKPYTNTVKRGDIVKGVLGSMLGKSPLAALLGQGDPNEAFNKVPRIGIVEFFDIRDGECVIVSFDEDGDPALTKAYADDLTVIEAA